MALDSRLVHTICQEYSDCTRWIFNKIDTEKVENTINKGRLLGIVNDYVDNDISVIRIKDTLQIYGLKDDSFEVVDESFNKEDGIRYSHLFSDCTTLKYLDIEEIDLSKLDSIQGFFSHCFNLKTLKLPKIRTDNIRNTVYMFLGCSSLEEIDLTDFNMSNITNCSFMFKECKNLKHIKLYNCRLNAKTNGMFDGCLNLEMIDNLDLNNLDVWMFGGCRKLDIDYLWYFLDNTKTCELNKLFLEFFSLNDYSDPDDEIYNEHFGFIEDTSKYMNNTSPDEFLDMLEFRKEYEKVYSDLSKYEIQYIDKIIKDKDYNIDRVEFKRVHLAEKVKQLEDKRISDKYPENFVIDNKTLIVYLDSSIISIDKDLLENSELIKYLDKDKYINNLVRFYRYKFIEDRFDTENFIEQYFYDEYGGGTYYLG